MDKRVELIIKELDCLEDEGKVLDVLRYYDYIDNEEDESYKISDLLSSSDSCVLTRFANNINIDRIGCISIANGVQTISFIFEDIVYKVTACDLNCINHFIDFCNERYEKEDSKIKLEGINPSSLICPVKLIYSTQDGVYIYSQETVKTGVTYCNSLRLPIGTNTGVFPPKLANCLYSFYKSKKVIEDLAEIFQKYFTDFINECDNDIVDDIHNGNWGFNKEIQPIIFDPFFFC